ncbi:hypothetical protein AUEXF2481DRAFT_474810 [Aureobasidium subglaciale EXF-2481]|uniref:Uncharacterized protein n=1 Tax=Aureobasidium subglaciale (strain EXF-2481) TaxID=1043005 RepID=A0A074YK97_AURSE|nr:uncharacterized protein AUEXF2481DRAFT_474810 [Aureobasidium subglaciale EXF-2481]KEQ98228.1 hypothetical protein AUEXF2481DRAFT_474810 [Aureobasidium subglaciale EXF-2481]
MMSGRDMGRGFSLNVTLSIRRFSIFQAAFRPDLEFMAVTLERYIYVQELPVKGSSWLFATLVKILSTSMLATFMGLKTMPS